MENQHTKIAGYRDLTQAEIDLMNEIKAHGNALEALLAKVYEHNTAQYKATEAAYAEPQNEDEEALGTPCLDTPEQAEMKVAERERLRRAEVFRWHAIAKTDMQTGLMALTRAVAQPTTF